MGDDPAVEARLKQLAGELRCLVCQNQTLADSNAPLAEDLRREVREMIVKDMSDREIVDFLVSRYGDFVLYRPPLKTTTMLLWVGPFVLLVGGGIALAVTLRRRQRMVENAVITDEEHRRVERLLSQGVKES
jgi:cytochrome c-type biogenesis protein CcmH